MLKPATKRFADNSNLSRFVFEYCCDCCGKALPPIVILPQDDIRKKLSLSSSPQEERAILYAAEHNRAFEHANNEILHKLNRCQVCGELVCEDCVEQSGSRCRRCAAEHRK